MQTKKNSIYITMAILGVVALILAGASSLSGRDSFAQDAPVTIETPAVPASAGDGSDILMLLAQMKDINLNTSIFSDPMFLALSDFTVELVEEPKSRPNPFAPIGQDATIEVNTGTSVDTSPFTASSTAVKLPPSGLPRTVNGMTME